MSGVLAVLTYNMCIKDLNGALPFDKLFEMLLDDDADPVLDPGDVGGIWYSGTPRNLIICEALGIIVTGGVRIL